MKLALDDTTVVAGPIVYPPVFFLRTIANTIHFLAIVMARGEQLSLPNFLRPSFYDLNASECDHLFRHTRTPVGCLAAIAALRRHAALCDWYEMEAQTGYRQYLHDIRQLTLPPHSQQTFLDGANDRQRRDLKAVRQVMEERRSKVNATIEMIEFIEAHKDAVRSVGLGIILTDPKDESTLQSLARRVLVIRM
jgi:hypothetical protein